MGCWKVLEMDGGDVVLQCEGHLTLYIKIVKTVFLKILPYTQSSMFQCAGQPLLPITVTRNPVSIVHTCFDPVFCSVPVFICF